MKKKLLKSLRVLLVAAGLCVGASAWADLTPGATTTVNFNNQTTPFSIYQSTRLGVSYALYEEGGSDYYANYNCGNRNGLPFASYDFSSLLTNPAQIVVSFDYNIPSGISNPAYITLADKDIHNSTNGGYNISSSNSTWGNNGVILAIGNARGKVDGSNTNYPAVNGVRKADLSFGTWYTANITVDVANKKVSYTIKAKGSDTTLDSGTDMDYWNTSEGTTANACNQIDISMANTGSIYIDNISITPYTDDSEVFASYTIKYMCGETEIKTAVTDRDQVRVGDYAALLSSDKESVVYNNQKYIYTSDNASTQAIKADGSTVVTVSFREAASWNYTVKNSLGSTLATGTAFEQDRVTVPFPRYVLDGTTLKGNLTTDHEYTFTLDSNNKEVTVNYSDLEDTHVLYAYRNNVLFYTEGESIENVTPNTSATNVVIRASNAAGASIPDGGVTVYSNLPAGKYMLLVGVHHYSNNANVTTTFTLGSMSIPVATSGTNRIETTTDEFTITEATNLVCSGISGNGLLDYVAIVKTGDVVSFTLGAESGDSYKSYVTTGNTDFATLGVTAYIAKAANTTNGTVTLSTIDTAPAGVPVLLKGTKGEYATITTTSTAYAAPETNYLVAADGSTAIGSSDAKYVLAYNSGWEFRHYNGTLSAGKVYLDLSSLGVGAARLSFIFDGEATGINSVQGSGLTVDDYYNLNGQRVNQPGKGLFIVNGKKVIVK